LADSCPDVWDPENVGSSVNWAADTLECQGSGGVTDCIREQPGTIGYIDAGHGHAERLEEVYLENRDGAKQTTIQAAARGGIAGAADVEGLMPASATADFSEVSLNNNPGEFTWPISLMTYVYVRQDLSFLENPQEQALLKAFLQSLYDDSYVQQCVDVYGFSKVDGSALQIAQDAIDSLILNATATEFQFEESTQLSTATGDYWISAKRSSASEVEIDALTVANQALAEEVAELALLVAETRSQVAEMAATGDSSSGRSLSGAGYGVSTWLVLMATLIGTIWQLWDGAC